MDIVAEEATCVREAIYEGPSDGCVTIPINTARMNPFGRCSKKRFYFLVAKRRIYSGFKRKGHGLLKVECSDGDSMQQFIERMEKIGGEKEKIIANKVKTSFLEDVRNANREEKKRTDEKR